MRYLSLVVIVMAFSTCLMSCGDSDHSQADQSGAAQSAALHQLLQGDLAGISNFSETAGAAALDSQSLSQPQDPNHPLAIFSTVFGGTSGADLMAYLNSRIQYYFTKYELQDATYVAGPLSYKNWLTSDVFDSGLFPGFTSNHDESDIKIAATNIGISYWMVGAVNNTVLTISVGNQNIQMSSPQNGIMEFGPGYTAQLPDYYRQSILIHEARHSDCTGGLSEQQIDKIRAEPSNAAFSQNRDAGECGHLHITCLDGEYQGLAACDDERYGAYGVQEVFVHAVELSALASGDENLIEQTDADEMDTLSRFSSQDGGVPDMSSENTPGI